MIFPPEARIVSTSCRRASSQITLHGEGAQVLLQRAMHTFALTAEVFLQLVALMAVVQGFDGLFEADGNQQAYTNDGDMDEEVGPRVRCLMRRMDVEHGSPG